MKLAAWVISAALALAAASCACKGSSSGPGTGPGTGGGTATLDTSCDGQTAHVRALYQAAAGVGEQPAITETEVADNVAMVMKECAAAAITVVPCLASVKTAAELERTCLPALDDEGTEGTVFLRP